MKYTLMFIAMFSFIALRAFQSRNVAHGHYIAVMPTSIAMAAFEVYVIAGIATEGYSPLLVAVIGSAGGLGCIAAIWLHKRMFR